MFQLFQSSLALKMKEDKSKKIQKYFPQNPLTRKPIIPEIMKYVVDFKLIHSINDTPIVGVALGHVGLHLIDPRSIDLIRRVIEILYNVSPLASQMIRACIPPNTVAVCFVPQNFRVGDHLHHFYPNPDIKCADKYAYINYQLLSPNIQACYFYVNGVDHLAGITYYLMDKSLKKKKKQMDADATQMMFAMRTKEPYPLRDRTTIIKNKCYGRYCQKVERRVMVDLNRDEVIHVLFSPHRQHLVYQPCMECRSDSLTYKWVDPSTTLPKTIPDEGIFILKSSIKMGDQEPHCLVYHRETGKLLPEAQWPKVTFLAHFLDENPDYNVHVNSALQARVVLDYHYNHRIGGNPVAAGEEEKEKEEKEKEIVGDLIDINTAREVEEEDQGLEMVYAKLEAWGLSNLNLNLNCLDEDLLAPVSQESSSSSPGPSTQYDEFVTDC